MTNDGNFWMVISGSNWLVWSARFTHTKSNPLILCRFSSTYFTHRTRGLAGGQTPRADPATINPSEQVTLFLLGFHLGFIQVIKPPGPMEESTIFLLGFHLGFIQLQKSEHREKADMHEVRRGFTFPTDFSENLTWNIVTQRCTKVIKHCACAVKWASLRRNSFRSGQTLSPARYFSRKPTFGSETPNTQQSWNSNMA